MARQTLAETIEETTRWHLTQNNGLLLGESLTAVGRVNNTVPDCAGIVELPMTDVAGAGIAVGTAVVGRRPIFVIRFQDFLILNGSPLIFYAAKLKELHGHTAPILVRAVAADGLGPVHSDVLHSIFMHFPGFRVCAPTTPNEYRKIFKDFLAHDDPMIVSEHRASYANTEELSDQIVEAADITLYAISATRLQTAEAVRLLMRDGIQCNVVNLLWLKPFMLTGRLTQPLCQSQKGLVIDTGHEITGAARSIAYELMVATGYPVRAVGLFDHTKCLCPSFDNPIPDAKRIYQEAKLLLEEK